MKIPKKKKNCFIFNFVPIFPFLKFQMMEAAYYHLPSPSDSERLRPYLQRQPIATPPHYQQVSSHLKLLSASLKLDPFTHRLNFHIRIQLISFNVSQRKRSSSCSITWRERKRSIWPRKLSKSKAGGFTQNT